MCVCRDALGVSSKCCMIPQHHAKPLQPAQCLLCLGLVVGLMALRLVGRTACQLVLVTGWLLRV
jgi:hypothetical protein